MRALRVALAAILMIGLSLVPVVPAKAAPQSASNYLASCAQSGGTLSALFVLDQSGSLSGTDPAGIRYDALQIALEQLARMRSTMAPMSVVMAERTPVTPREETM